MQDPIIEQGLNLLVFGMGTVFFFLAVLVLVTTLMSQVMTRFFAETPAESQSAAAPSPATTQQNPHLVAIFKAAIEQHKAKQ